MKNITTEEVIYKLYLSQSRFGELYEFVWCNLEQIQSDDVTHFTSKDFQEGLFLCGV